MRSLQRFGCWGLFCLSLALFGASARAADWTSEQRVIVKWKSDLSRNRSQAFSATSQRMNSLTGVELVGAREIDSQREVVRFNKTLSIVGFQSVLATLRAQSDIEYAVPDQWRHAHLVPNDPYFGATTGRTGQWYLQNTEVAAIDAVHAWDISNVTAQSSNVTVAVVDTGVRKDHPDLSSKFLQGYDFVSGESATSFLTANDGNGWDNDPSDPGDWISSADLQNSLFKDCDESDSSWHGTRVSGIIGAVPNNGIGIAGIGWNVKILPVRALGKCGGWDSDIIAAMRWAAGIDITGVPHNANPAKIINLSLGGSGDCKTDANYQHYRDAITEIRTAGALIVASAGNDGGPVNAPANCSGVIGVAGIRNIGTKVGYSSVGTAAAIAAPAGNCVNPSGACLYSIDTTFNTGQTTPVANDNAYTDQTHTNLGTSFSAPIVSGTLALMLAANPNLSPDLAQSRLQASATPFPTTASLNCHVPTSSSDTQTSECNCTTSTCGAGMVNALKAVQFATQQVVALITGANTAGVNRQVVLDASGSSTLGTGPLTYAWSVDNGALSSNSTANTTFTAPSTHGTTTVSLTVTDAAAQSDTRTLTITTYAAPTVSISGPTTATAGLSVNLTATASTADSAPATYLWSVTSGTATLSGASQSAVTVILPNSQQTLVLHVVATDDLGNTATADQTITVSPSVVSAASNAGTTAGSSSGGGSFALDVLLGLSLLALARGKMRPKRRAECRQTIYLRSRS